MAIQTLPMPETETATTYFRCFGGCEGKYSIYDVIYRCPKCSSLLEVHHEREPLQQTIAYKWQQLFDSRASTTTWPYGSGVWAMKEWIMPNLANDNVVSMAEGNTNLFWADRLGKQLNLPDLWIKLCGNSHTGSFKDLGMTVLVSVVKQMMASGKTSPVKAVACASTGDTSAALAAYAAYAGIPAIIFLPAGKVSTAQLDPAGGQWSPCPRAGHRFRWLHEDRSGSDAGNSPSTSLIQ